VRPTHATLVKEALLRQLDHTLQRDFRQTLSEVLTELNIRNAVGQQVRSPDSILCAIKQSRILDCKATSEVLQLRAALDRVVFGKFGLCILCGRKISTPDLERNPLQDYCSSCVRRRSQIGPSVK
jgi:RNA polymerase-binding transcription factor DksA